MVENKVVEFVYNGGSTPGKSRKVFVYEVDANGFSGYDFSRQHVRRFLKSKTGKYSVDKTAKVIDVDSLPSTVTVATIERGLQADGYEVHNEYPYVVGVKLPPKRKLSTANGNLTIEGPGGKLYVNIARGVSLYENGTGINFNADDPLPLYEAIKRVLGV